MVRRSPHLVCLAVALLLALALAGCAQLESGEPSGSSADPEPAPAHFDQPVNSDDPASSSSSPLSIGVRGRVTGPSGQPLAGVLVAPESTASPPEPIPEIAIYTDDQGRYAWSLPPGPYTLTFRAEGYPALSRPVVVPPGQPLDLDVQLAP